MLGIKRSTRAGRVIATAAALAAPAALAAQTNYSQCGTEGGSGQACYAAQLSLSGSTLTLLLQNNGPTASRISGFGLFDMMTAGGAQNTFMGTPTSVGYYDNGQLIALPLSFLQSGAPSGLENNQTPTFQLAYNFGQGGLTPCAGTNGGNGTMIQTCSNNLFTEALQVTFGNVSGIGSASELGLGVRFQSVANANNQGDGGSLRCLSNLGQTGNCTNNPGGGLQGGGLTGGGAGSVVPEPSTYALMGTGLLGLAGLARRRNRKS